MMRISSNQVSELEKQGIDAVRNAGPECMVLLKNDANILPLRKTQKIGLYGNGARRTVKGGTGSGDVNVRHVTTVEEGIRNTGAVITSTAWLDQYDAIYEASSKQFFRNAFDTAIHKGENPMHSLMWLTAPEPEYIIPVEVDSDVDTAIYVLARNSGEGVDRCDTSGDIRLTDTEIRDILSLNQQYTNFVLVLNVGGVVDVTPLLEVDTILLMSQLGIASGDSLADVLFGKAYPSGKLTATWAPVKDYPSTAGFGHPNDTYYSEGIYVGYRYFDTVNYTPLFPFGFGLGYTQFDIKDTHIVADENQICITVTVKNVGAYAGKETIQVYVSAPQTGRDKPYQELKGYMKTKELNPTESDILTIVIPTDSLGSFDTDKSAYTLESGMYVVRLGTSSRNTTIIGRLVLDETLEIEKVKAMYLGDVLQESVPAYIGLDNDSTYGVDCPIIHLKARQCKRNILEYSGEPMEMHTHRTSDWRDVMNGTAQIDEFVAQLTNEELAHICIGNFSSTSGTSIIGNASDKVAGGAGETTHFMRRYAVPELVMADGPAGLRLSQVYNIRENGNAISKKTSFNAAYVTALTQEELIQCGMINPDDEASIVDTSSVNTSNVDTSNVNTSNVNASNIDASSRDTSHGVANSGPDYYQYCTAIPIGTALAQSWNDKLVYQLGHIVGREMENFGISIWLAPALNIQRSPLCGRNFEYFSEDPLISGKMAAALTRGVQSHPGCAVTIKHFAANNQETNRYTSNSIVSIRALREIYLKGFEICVKESAPKVCMTAYNLINGEHASQTKELLTYILRDEWGFNGFVMSDWYVTGGMESGTEKYPAACAAGHIKGGNDMTMPGSQRDIDDILCALEDGSHPYTLTRAALQLAAKRILRTILMLTSH